MALSLMLYGFWKVKAKGISESVLIVLTQAQLLFPLKCTTYTGGGGGVEFWFWSEQLRAQWSFDFESKPIIMSEWESINIANLFSSCFLWLLSLDGGAVNAAGMAVTLSSLFPAL